MHGGVKEVGWGVLINVGNSMSRVKEAGSESEGGITDHV
jgi:hypothetical protein